MSEHEEDAPAKIKVTDRRLFDKDGNFRDDAAAEPEPSPTEPAPQTGRPEPAKEVVPEREVAESAPEPPEPEPAPEAASPQPAAAEAPENAGDDTAAEPTTHFSEEALMRFIEEQYIGGLLALGAMPEPQTGQVMEDLDLAQVRIEMLGLLREHADASLSLEARKGVDDVIYQLRMAYLQKRKVVKL